MNAATNRELADEHLTYPIACRLFVDSLGGHVQQLLTGFAVLSRAGIVRRTDAIGNPDLASSPRRFWTLTALVNESVKVAFDVGDRREVDARLLHDVDCYFKRTYVSSYVRSLGAGACKVQPLGLNYEVYPNHADFPDVVRAWRLLRGRRRLSGVVRMLRLSPTFLPRQEQLEGDAAIGVPPRVVFLTRAWDPHDDPTRSHEDVLAREQLNETRAACIAALRRAFGDRAVTGFAPSEYAIRKYRAFVVPDHSLTKRRKYVAALRTFPICVATTGLHGSIGWKMGEYVALAKAIVSESLECELPGNFLAGRNYLGFDSPEQCVARVDELMSDATLRASMMIDNARYYREFVRPDRLVLNSLVSAIRQVPSTRAGTPVRASA